MGVKNLPDGQDFGPEHFPSDFGFSKSSSPAKGTRHERGPAPAHNPVSTDEHGPGSSPGNESHFAKGGDVHPHGHQVVDAQVQPDGSVVHHHGHGGISVHHADGHISHHDQSGAIVHGGGGMPPGAMQDASTHVGKMQRGGGEPDGDEGGMGEAGGGALGGAQGLAIGGRPHLPRAMKPPMARPRSPIGHAPPAPTRTPSPRNAGAGGAMAMGVEPSAEPDQAGTLPGAPPMRKGGRV